MYKEAKSSDGKLIYYQYNYITTPKGFLQTYNGYCVWYRLKLVEYYIW